MYIKYFVKYYFVELFRFNSYEYLDTILFDCISFYKISVVQSETLLEFKVWNLHCNSQSMVN